jgi:RHS repeat-associated protein
MLRGSMGDNARCAAGVALAMFALATTAAADTDCDGPDIPVEEAMRQLQARQIYVAGNANAFEWPDCICAGSPAPQFPADDYYDLDEKNPDRAVVLVEAVYEAMWGVELHKSFIEGRPTTGVSWSSIFYDDADMTSRTFHQGVIDRDNYIEALAAILSDIDLLREVEVDVTWEFLDADRGPSDPPGTGNTLDTGMGVGSVTRCEDWGQAKTDAETDFDWANDFSEPSLGVARYYIAKGTRGYQADVYSKKGKVSDAGDLDEVYYKVAPYTGSGGSFGGVQVGGDAASADAWYMAGAGEEIGGTDWTAGEIDASCPQGTTITRGWKLVDEHGIAAPDFDDEADKVACGDSGCSSGACADGSDLGSISVSLGSAEIYLPLGKTEYGDQVGYLHLRVPYLQTSDAELINAGLYNSLRFYPNARGGGYDQYIDDAAPDRYRQIKVPDGLVELRQTTEDSVNDTYAYRIDFYDDGVVTGSGPWITPVDAEFKSISVTCSEQTGGDTLTVAEDLEADGTVDRSYTFTYDGSVWSLSEADASSNIERTQSISRAWDTYGTTLTELIEVRDGLGVLDSRVVNTYYRYDWGKELISEAVWVDEQGTDIKVTTWTYYDNKQTDEAAYGKIKSREDWDGDWAHYIYDDVTGRLVRKISRYLDGVYDPVYLQLCAESNRVHDYVLETGDVDGDPTTREIVRSVSEYIFGHQVQRSYDIEWEQRNDPNVPNGYIRESWTIRCSTVGIADTLPAVGDIPDPVAEVAVVLGQTSAGHAITKRWWWMVHVGGGQWSPSSGPHYQLPLATLLPDGELTVHEFPINAGVLPNLYGPPGTDVYGRTYVTWSGLWSGEYDQQSPWLPQEVYSTSHRQGGSVTTTTKYNDGRLSSREVKDGESSIVLSLTEIVATDDLGRPTQTQATQGGTVLNEYTTYDCCGVGTRTDHLGAMTSYTYDDLGRAETVTTNANVTGQERTVQYSYDAMDRRISEQITEPGGGSYTARSWVYDLSGRLESEFDALSNETSHTEVVMSALGVVQTTTTFADPDGPTGPESPPTRVTERYADGQLKSLSGIGQAPVLYEYGIDQGCPGRTSEWLRYSKTTYPDDASTSQWIKTYRDMLGRAICTVYADGAYATKEYSPGGRLVIEAEPRFATDLPPFESQTVFYFEGEGTLGDTTDLPEALRSGSWRATVVDTNGNGSVDWSTDQITVSQSSISVRDSEPVSTEITLVAATDGSTAVNYEEVSRSETSLDGMYTWRTQYGVELESETVLTPSQVKRTITSHLPRAVGSAAPVGRSVTVEQYGRVISEQVYDAQNSLVRDVAISETYDGLGERTVSTAETYIDQLNGDTQTTRTTTTRYDQMGNPVCVTRPAESGSGAGRIDVYEYDNLGRRTTVRLNSTGCDDPPSSQEEEVITSYYPSGQIKRREGFGQYPVEYTYDDQNRLTNITTWRDASGGTGVTTMGRVYDSQRGWLTQRWNGVSDVTAYDYTAAGRVRSRTWARGVTTVYAYVGGQLMGISYTDGTPNVTYQYDRPGRIHKVFDDAGVCTYTYESAGDGRLDSEVYTTGGSGDSILAGISLDHTYDVLARREQLDVDSAISGDLNLVNFGYDDMHRLETVTKHDYSSPPNDFHATYTYHDYSDLVSQVRYDRGTQFLGLSYRTQDALGRLVDTAWLPSSIGLNQYSYQYDAFDRRDRVDLPDQTWWEHDFDDHGQLIDAKRRFVEYDGGQFFDRYVPGQQFEYDFDDIGNRTQVRSGGDKSGSNLRPSGYAMTTSDELNQYASRDITGYLPITGYASIADQVFVDGALADRVQQYFHHEKHWSSLPKVEDVTISIGTPPVVEQRSVFMPDDPELFTYDADGNLTSDGRWTYEWDAENRLVRMETLPGLDQYGVPIVRIEMDYDAQHRRIRKRVLVPRAIGGGDPPLGGPLTNPQSAGVTTLTPQEGVDEGTAPQWDVISEIRYIWDGWLLTAEIDQDDDLIRSYAWGLDLSGSRQGAGGIGGMLFQTDGATDETYHAFYDGHGNLVSLCDAFQVEVASYEYGPFGELLAIQGPYAGSNPMRYSTKYTDEESGLLYYGYRYYNPSTGRWLSRDPIGEEGGLNLYGFVGNEPTGSVDALGLEVWKLRTWLDWAFLGNSIRWRFITVPATPSNPAITYPQVWPRRGWLASGITTVAEAMFETTSGCGGIRILGTSDLSSPPSWVSVYKVSGMTKTDVWELDADPRCGCQKGYFVRMWHFFTNKGTIKIKPVGAGGSAEIKAGPMKLGGSFGATWDINKRDASSRIVRDMVVCPNPAGPGEPPLVHPAEDNDVHRNKINPKHSGLGPLYEWAKGP